MMRGEKKADLGELGVDSVDSHLHSVQIGLDELGFVAIVVLLSLELDDRLHVMLFHSLHLLPSRLPVLEHLQALLLALQLPVKLVHRLIEARQLPERHFVGVVRSVATAIMLCQEHGHEFLVSL
jgi:hypothetical protein